jgi:MFS family permease
MLGLPRPVWLLGWVSLATDAASEAIYPLLPFFLTRVLSAGAVSLGIVEGAAEAANSLLKIASGRWADRSRTKRPLVLLGYGVSSAMRPMVALATTWTQVFLVRMLDRVGKGVRGAPRDAMLAGWAEPTTRGKVYGFHRGMDHIGAVIGPALASVFLFFFPDRYRTLFALTVVPGTIAVLLILLVPEPDAPEHPRSPSSKHPAAPDPQHPRASGAKHLQVSDAEHPKASVPKHPEYIDRLPKRFCSFMGVLALFALGNSTDAFLLLKLTDAAGGVQFVPLMWAALHVVKAVVSMVGGMWSDRIGRRAVIASGWLIYALVYGGFATSTSLSGLLAWFMLYGFYFGFAEGTEKALVADLAPVSRRGTAFGIYNAVTGLGALLASIVFGAVWSAFGSSPAFWLGAALALAATVMLFVVVTSRTSDLVNA